MKQNGKQSGSKFKKSYIVNTGSIDIPFLFLL